MTFHKAIDEIIATFAAAGMDGPQFEARQMVQECLGLTFAQLMSDPDRILSGEILSRLKEWSGQRAKGVPLAYLSGHKGFYKYDFLVEPGVLVPRPETEIVVETALRRIEERASTHLMADLGSGSGCIGLSIASELTELLLWAVDVSAKACEVTRKNAIALGVMERVKIENSKVEEWKPGLAFDLIVANPPYICAKDTAIDPNVKKHEPHEALFAGEEGLEFVQGWAAWAYQHLRPKGGIFISEIGAGQSRSVQDIFAKQGFDQIQIERDLAGHERVISGIRVR
jgi:release factor glutamine methyltransferase